MKGIVIKKIYIYYDNFLNSLKISFYCSEHIIYNFYNTVRQFFFVIINLFIY